jgi:hypothetical protein
VKQKSASIVIALFAMFVLAACAGEARSQIAPIDAGDMEVGLILGEPTGLSGKLWATGNTAFDLGVAWSFGDGGHFHIHGDYLFHNFDFFDVNTGSLPIYFGIGGRIRLQDEDSRVGLRIAIGLEYIMESAPVGFFFEVVPIVDFAPETEADVNGGIGVRYIF